MSISINVNDVIVYSWLIKQIDTLYNIFIIPSKQYIRYIKPLVNNIPDTGGSGAPSPHPHIRKLPLEAVLTVSSTHGKGQIVPEAHVSLQT